MSLCLSRRGWMAGVAMLGLSTAVRLPAAARSGPHWLGAWGAALTPVADAPSLVAGARTGRAVVASLAGRAVRLRISNERGTQRMRIAGVLAGGKAATFGGLPQIDIPPGASIVTDPIDLVVAAGQTIALALSLPEGGRLAAAERQSDGKGGWIEEAGARRDALPSLFSALEVSSDRGRPVAVILSDTKSAGPGTWPELLAARNDGSLGIVNRSVYGGHLALGPAGASALARFDSDVLGTSGATHVVIFAGNNDLIQPGMIGSSGRPSLDPALMQSAGQLIALLGQAAARARAAGLLAVGVTWLPYEGVTIAQGYSTPEKLAIRDEVNGWIRSKGAFDRLLDFDAALRDPARPSWLARAYDSGNHFTPNAAGNQVMADLAARVLLS